MLFNIEAVTYIIQQIFQVLIAEPLGLRSGLSFSVLCVYDALLIGTIFSPALFQDEGPVVPRW